MKPDGTESLQAQASRGYKATLVSQGLRVLCKAGSVVALARLVTPAEHGHFAMAASVFYVVILFRDLGLSAASLPARELSEEQCTTLCHAHALLGLLLAAVTLALAPVVAAYYHEPRVRGLLATMSVGLVLIGLNAWPRALLTRGLRFGELNRLETVSVFLGTIAMIVAGALGAGAFSFVTFLLVSETVALVEAWRLCGWWPRAAARWSSLRAFWRTGTDLTGYNVLLSILTQIDTILMGRWFGAAAVGYYNRPNQLLSLPMQHIGWPLTQVMLATLARHQGDSRDFPRHVRRTANLIAHLTLPLAAWCIALPHETVRLLLGPAWPEAAPLLRWLAFSAAATYLGATIYGVSVVTLRTRQLALMTAIMLGATVAGLQAGRAYGPEGLAAAMALTNLALLVPRLWWATRDTPLRLRDYAEAFAGPLAVALAFGGGLAAGRLALGAGDGLGGMVAGGSGGIVAVAVLAIAWRRVREEFRSVWQHLPFRRARREPGNAA